jgi:hypothetical protein
VSGQERPASGGLRHQTSPLTESGQWSSAAHGSLGGDDVESLHAKTVETSQTMRLTFMTGFSHLSNRIEAPGQR